MLDQNAKGKSKYESPIVVPLGEIAKGSGVCETGSSVAALASTTGSSSSADTSYSMVLDCTAGLTATRDCTAGTAALRNCSQGVSALPACTAGVAATAACTAGGHPSN